MRGTPPHSKWPEARPLDEVWVITTKSISTNAKTKIHEEFKHKNIQFIDGAQLVQLVDKYMPDFWLDIHVSIGTYLSKIKAQFLEIDRRYDIVSTGDEPFFIDPEIAKIANNPYLKIGGQRKRKQDDELVNIKSEIDRQRFILLEGTAGSGKSKLLRQLVIHYSSPEVYVESNIVPCYITFKELVDEFSNTIFKVIQNKLSDVLPHLRQQDRILLLIDGVDEKDMTPAEQVEIIKSVEEQVATKNIIMKVMMASRILRGIRTEHRVLPVRISYQIQPLSMQQLSHYLEALCTRLNIKSRILEDVNKSLLFKQISRTPVSAILLAELLNKNSEDVPSNLTELYTKYLELTLGRWEIERGLQSQREYETLSIFLMDLAEYMLENEVLYVSIPEAQNMLSNYLSRRNLDINSANLFRRMLDRYEIVVENTQDYTICFKHKTFMEYYYAKKKLINRGLKLDQRAFGLYWMNMYFFYFGLLRDAPELIEEVINLPPIDIYERLLKSINLPNYLLAAYSTPYDTIAKGVEGASIEAAKLYLDIVENKANTPLSTLPRMHVFYIIQILIRSSLSYTFFERALSDAALNIASNNEYTKEEKSYAIFFLSVCQADLGHEDFDFLLEELGDIPLDVSLAIEHESEGFSTRSSTLNKHRRKIDKLLKSDKSSKSLTKKWYETPVLLFGAQGEKMTKKPSEKVPVAGISP